MYENSMSKSISCAALLAALLVTFAQAAGADDSPTPPAQAQQASLPRIVVTGAHAPDDHYRVESVDALGPLGSTQLLDTPYSVAILPEALIENSQATNFKDVSKYLPLVAYQEQQGPDILRPQTRGMQGGNFQNSKLDGMTFFVTVANAMEQFQQLEVVNGVSASLYGPANPSGMFNFISKRPTDYDLRRVSVTYASDSIGTAHVDLGGRIDKNGVFSYRLNALFGEGGGFVDASHVRRALGDLAIDIRPIEDTVLELNYSDYHLVDKGYPGWFTYSETVTLPSAPDPERVGYGQSYAGTDLETRMASARIKRDFSSDWHLVFGGLNQDATRNINTPVNNLRTNSGNYASSLANGFAPRFVITSDTGYLNGTFATWGLGHDLTIGTAGYRAQSYSVITPATAPSVLLGTANINDPQIFPYPAAGLPNPNRIYDSSTAYQQGINVGDTIRITDEWSTRLAVSQDWFHTDNYSAKAVALPEYADHGLSPTGSILYKPLSNMTVYATYASSLQAGDLAPGTAVNAGEGLAPYRSKEYELGFKASLMKFDLTAAVFRIQRPFANLDPTDDVFKISGEQVNRGLELSAIGEIANGLTVYGGVTLLNARLENTPLASTNDRIYVGAPKVKGNTLFEYRFPTIEGLVTSFDWQFSGPRPGNDTNSFFVAGYNLFDVGVRYTSPVLSKSVTWRLAVNNIADRHYWSTVGPSNLTGANTGSLLAHLGSPRMALASVSIDF
jgi:iron complex outermembrane recepter protein